MKIAIDNNVKERRKDFIYVFDDNEKVSELIKTGLHCIHKDNMMAVDINLSEFNISCIKKAKITDKDWDKIPEKRDYKFAIIIPNCNNDHGNYNGKTFFQNCIESVLNQKYKNFELIIVDDMSIDTSVETVKKYKDKRIHLIQNKRKRYNGGSRNAGIEYALDNFDFDYFCFLDSDDWWKDNEVLQDINDELYDHELMVLDLELLENTGITYQRKQTIEPYIDFFLSINNLWCTAWCRVIRKDKIVYFCEDTLMEDRVWSYKQADNVNYDKVKKLDRVCYVWNRTNYGNSVSMTNTNIWRASAWCHIGHQLQMLEQLKHKEMIPIIEERIQECKKRCNNGSFQQY